MQATHRLWMSRVHKLAVFTGSRGLGLLQALAPGSPLLAPGVPLQHGPHCLLPTAQLSASLPVVRVIVTTYSLKHKGAWPLLLCLLHSSHYNFSRLGTTTPVITPASGVMTVRRQRLTTHPLSTWQFADHASDLPSFIKYTKTRY